MKRKIISVCSVLLLLFGFSDTVFADEFNIDRMGSITVTLTDNEENKAIVGAEISLYYVAEIEEIKNDKIRYIYTKEFENSKISLDDKDFVTKIEDFITQKEPSCIKAITNQDGSTTFEELPLGVYYLMQTSSVDGFAPCIPFIVTVPNENNGDYVYDVDATPKTEVQKLTSITIKKVWNTNAAAKASKNVKVELLNDGKVVKTAVLDSENDWQITYNNMPKSDAYSVREVNIPKGFTATYKQKGYVFTVTNTAALIQTGQLIWPIPVLAMSGMLLIAVGFVFLRKKRKTNA